jgi:lysophospholipid acyltransferase (LPLAT)-like uncharacterized protein
VTGGLRQRVVSAAGERLLDLVLRTARYDLEGGEHVLAPDGQRRQVVYAFWHGRILPLSYFHRGLAVTAMVSRSEDGEYIARILERWGYCTARGSSSRGGPSALREFARHARAGRSLALTPDGPRGPRQTMKLGALVAAQLTGLPILPLSAGTTRAWWIEGWDRFMVPKPFARIRVVYGPLVAVPRDADTPELERLAGRVGAELDRLTRLADGDS